MHAHVVCNHELKHCRVCDVAYCEKCGTEWYRNHYTVSYNPYQGMYISDKIEEPQNISQSHVHSE